MKEIDRNILVFSFWLLLFLNIILLYVVIDTHYNNVYLSKELNRTNTEKTLLIQKLELYESAKVKH